MLDITFILQSFRITAHAEGGKVYRKNVPFFDTLLGERKRVSQHLCPAGPDPASHPVKPVGTQRVALNKKRMGLRVKARKDKENEHVDRCAQLL